MGWLRHPRTTQERRANGRRGVIEIDEFLIRLRAKRNSYRLPQHWDDIIRGDIEHRTWKRHRRQQYKE